ncbi:MAG: GDP-L-fucose synthase [Desulfobacterales bacterium]
MDKRAPIYVAGHQGMVGSAVVRRLTQAGFTQIITRRHGELDLERQGAVEEFFRSTQPEYVILAAAKVGGIWANQSYPAEFIYSNLAIQTHLLHSAHRFGVKQLLFLGSSCIYPRECPQPMAERYLLSGPLEPTNRPYAVAKIAGIEMCRAYNRQYGTRFLAVMPTNLYGPHDNFDLTTSHVLPALIRKFHLAKLARAGDLDAITRDVARFGPLPETFGRGLGLTRKASRWVSAAARENPSVELWGTGAAYREFLHVDDMADACIHLMEVSQGRPLADHRPKNNPEPPDSNGEAPAAILPFYNVGSGKDLKIRELTALICRVVGYDGAIVWDPSKPDGTPRKRLDPQAMFSLNWRPKIQLAQGIEHTYDWYLNQY